MARGTLKFAKPKNPLKTLMRLIKYFGKKKYLLIVVFLLVVYTSFAQIFGSYMLGVIIDTAIKHENYSLLINDIVLLVCIYGLGVLCDLTYTQMMVRLAQDVIFNIRKELSTHLQDLPIKYFDEHPHGEIMSYFTNDVDTLVNALNDSFANIIFCFCNIVGTIVILAIINIYLALIIYFFMALLVLFIFFNTKKCRKYYTMQQSEIANINSKVEEDINGMKVSKAFNHEEESFESFDKVNKSWLEASQKSFFHTQLNVPVIVSLSYLEFTIASIVGACFLVNKWISGLGSLTTYIVNVRQSAQPFNMFTQHINNILTALAGCERIFSYLDEESEIDEGKVTLVKLSDEGEYKNRYSWNIPTNEETYLTKELRGEIVFKDVTFGYNDEKIVLDDISFYAKDGQKIAFVGSTGAGKTTIISLINRFYNISKGEIYYDGINIKDIKLDDLRRAISMVTQDTHLFTGTIKDNILYSRRHSTFEEVVKAAKIANCDSWIKMLPQGYDTILFDDGHNLSQGQRQLLSLARACLSMPPLLILDEATSNIDTRSERLVQKAMDELMKNRTTLVIAHRLSTIKNADAILYLENGKIIERGTNAQLLELKGKYYALYQGKVELE